MMKSSFFLPCFLGSFLIYLIACDRTLLLRKATNQEDILTGTYRSMAEAESIVGDFITQSKTKSHVGDRFCVTRTITKDGIQTSGDTLLYVFNLNDNDGFAIVSADYRDFPIIAITEQGHLDETLTTGVEPFDEYLSSIMDVLTSREPQRGPHPLYRHEIFCVDHGVEPMVSVKWGQGGVFGDYCPNSTAGCVATAVVQIMTKYSTPASFVASIPLGPYSAGQTVTLHWDYIKQHIKNHTTTSDPCCPYHQEISALLREIGHRVNMIYYFSPSHSWAAYSNVPDALSSLGYYCSALQSYNRDYVIESLNSGFPVFLSGDRRDTIHTKESPGDSVVFRGHAFVVDGYHDYAQYYQTWIWNGTSWVLFEQTEISGSHVFHINWGWEGDCNGYFPFDVFNTSLAEEYDGTSNNTGRNYLYHKRMITYIHPQN